MTFQRCNAPLQTLGM